MLRALLRDDNFLFSMNIFLLRIGVVRAVEVPVLVRAVFLSACSFASWRPRRPSCLTCARINQTQAMVRRDI